MHGVACASDVDLRWSKVTAGAVPVQAEPFAGAELNNRGAQAL